MNKKTNTRATHRRDPATEPCLFCEATIGKPCRQRIWNFALGSYRPLIGSKVKQPHMTSDTMNRRHAMTRRSGETVDQRWTVFVRQWRDMMRELFLPQCSRTEPCCEFECPDMATHFARTGDIP